MTITRRSLLTALAASPLAACVPVAEPVPREVQLARTSMRYLIVSVRRAASMTPYVALDGRVSKEIRWRDASSSSNQRS